MKKRWTLSRIWEFLKLNPKIFAGLLLVGFFALMALLGQIWTPYSVTRMDSTSVSILERGVLINKYSGIDRGICMLHAAVGASKAGRNPSWKKVDLGYELHA